MFNYSFWKNFSFYGERKQGAKSVADVDFTGVEDQTFEKIENFNLESMGNKKFLLKKTQIKCVLKNKHDNKLKLSYINFTKQDLSGLDFSDLDLSGCDFSGANLSKCNFAKTNIQDAVIVGADFSGAFLSLFKNSSESCIAEPIIQFCIATKAWEFWDLISSFNEGPLNRFTNLADFENNINDALDKVHTLQQNLISVLNEKADTSKTKNPPVMEKTLLQLMSISSQVISSHCSLENLKTLNQTIDIFMKAAGGFLVLDDGFLGYIKEDDVRQGYLDTLRNIGKDLTKIEYFAIKVKNTTSWDFKSVSESLNDKSAEALNFDNNYMSTL